MKYLASILCLILPFACFGQQVKKTPGQLPQAAVFGPTDILLGSTGTLARSTRGINTSNLLESLALLTNWQSHVTAGGQTPLIQDVNAAGKSITNGNIFKAAVFTDTGFAANGVVTNDATGKLFTSTFLPATMMGTNMFIAPGSNVTITTNYANGVFTYTIASTGGGGGIVVAASSTITTVTNGSIITPSIADPLTVVELDVTSEYVTNLYTLKTNLLALGTDANGKIAVITNSPANWGLFGPTSGGLGAANWRHMIVADMATNSYNIASASVSIVTNVNADGSISYTFTASSGAATATNAVSQIGTNAVVNGNAITNLEFWTGIQEVYWWPTNVGGREDISATVSNLPNAALQNSTVGVAGTANQITSSSSAPALGASTTLSIPSVFIAPGTLAAVTGMTNQSFSSVGIVTNDANGKLYSSPVIAESQVSGLTTDIGLKADKATTITVAGTANQITSSAGAQDLSANRTWTLTIPAVFIAPGTLAAVTGITNQAFTTVGIVTNDDKGKLFTSTFLPSTLMGTNVFLIPGSNVTITTNYSAGKFSYTINASATGSLTPWTTDINAAGYALTNLGLIVGTNGASIGFGGALSNLLQVTSVSDGMYRFQVTTNGSIDFGTNHQGYLNTAGLLTLSGPISSVGITNQGFSTQGWVTNDANGKLYTSANVPNSALANSSITVAGTANQVSVSGGGPVALGGTATLSTPSVFIAPGTLAAVTSMTNQSFSSIGALTNDANGKFYSTPLLDPALLNLIRATNNDTVVSNGLFTLLNTGTNDAFSYARTIGGLATNRVDYASNLLWLKITNTYVAAGANITVTTNRSGQDLTWTIAGSAGGSGTGIQTNGGSGTNNPLTGPLLFNPNGLGTTYYVATNGSSGNSGLNTNAPWDLATAMSSAGASNTIVVLPGEYTNIYLASVANCSYQTWKSQVKWAARIKGTTGLHGISSATGVTNVTIDGFEVAYSYITGIKPQGNNGWTLRNNWVHHSGRGNPSWTTNTDQSFIGNGIECYGNNMVIENNLIENNGAYLAHDHGIYYNGTNGVIRGNVIRYNLAFGIQAFPGSANTGISNLQIYDNQVYNNAWPPAGMSLGPTYGGRNCITVWASDAGEYTLTNYVYGNTLQNSGTNSYAVIDAQGGYLMVTNNIILGADNYLMNAGNNGGGTVAQVYEDYCVSTNTFPAQTGCTLGAHNVTGANGANLVNFSKGLFWLNGTSGAKGTALSTCFGPIDFFGGRQVSVADIGAFQYNSLLSGDYRTLDPSTTNGADYWIAPSISQSNYYGNFIGGTFSGLSALSNSANYSLAGLNDVTNTANSYSNGVAIKTVTVAGTANQITSSVGTAQKVGDSPSTTLSIPSVFIAPGTLAAVTGITNQAFTAVGVVTNDDKGKLFTSPIVPALMMSTTPTNDLNTLVKTYTNETTLRVYQTNVDQTILTPTTATNTMPLYGGFWRLVVSGPAAITNLTGVTAGIYTYATCVFSNSLATTITNRMLINAIASGYDATNSVAALGLNGFVVGAGKQVRLLVDAEGINQTNWMLIRQ